MPAPRPGPEPLRGDAPVAVPRVAASVLVLRGGADALEVLLVQRTHAARFMAGVWVFPGGAVDREEGEGDAARRAAAAREVEEEAGVRVDPAALVPYSRWITPEEVKIRFDTWFFLVPAPDDAAPRVDGAECIDWRWSTPRAALDANAAGELALVFPTIRHLEQVAAFDSAHALLAHARGLEIEPVMPRVVGEGEVARIVLPGEPGYAEAG